MGWILNPHAEYFNQEMARADLQCRIEWKQTDLELVPNTSSHIISAGTNISTKSLKVRADYDSRQENFGVFGCSKKGRDDPTLTEMSNTDDWKLIPFAQNILSRDQMTIMINK